MNKKYELTDEVKLVNGVEVHRIKALKDFADVRAGDLGGWIEKEDNLSHEGNCWVDDEAIVIQDAQVIDDAIVYEHATICENAQIEKRAMIYGKAVIDGYAIVSDDTTIYASAHVGGHARVYNNASVHGNAMICDRALISGSTNILRNTQIKGNAIITDNAYISGNIVISDNVFIGGNTCVTGYAKITGKKMILSNEDLKPLYKSSTPFLDRLLDKSRQLYGPSIIFKSLHPTELNIDKIGISNITAPIKVISSNRKYELTNKSIVSCGSKLFRIKALKDFGDVKAGDLGGWIEKEVNLSQKGNCWVYNSSCITKNAIVMNDAVIKGCSMVTDDALVSGSAKIIGVSVISENAYVTDNARVSNSIVRNNAQISGNTQIGGTVIDVGASITNGVFLSRGHITNVEQVNRIISARTMKLPESNINMSYADIKALNDPILTEMRDSVFRLLNEEKDEEIFRLLNKGKDEEIMSKKYELTEETKIYDNAILHRIKALKDFSDVKKGDLGGWIEKEENLSHEGNCWVYNEAVVMDNAQIQNSAIVFQFALVGGSAIVEDSAKVGCHASVNDGAHISERSMISDNATIAGCACISDYAVVMDDATVIDNAKIVGNTCISGHATVMDDALVGGYAVVSGLAIIRDKAQIKGHATILDAVIKNDVIVDGCYKIDDCTVITNAAQLPMFAKWKNRITTSDNSATIDYSLTTKKYELTDETKTIYNGKTVVHRIKALRDFGDVKAGDLGGFIEGEFNLSHKGNCWAYDGVIVCGRAGLYDNDIIRNTADNGNMTIFDYRKILGPL